MGVGDKKTLFATRLMQEEFPNLISKIRDEKMKSNFFLLTPCLNGYTYSILDI